MSEKKKLVAYFSAGGVTARAAAELAKAAEADLFEIVPELPYKEADLDWMNAKSRSSVEMKNPASRPAIASKASGMEDYDVVYIGFPIWWYVAPTIINTFLEGYDFSGKTVVLFATSGGSGFGNTVKALRGSVASSAKLIEGAVFRGGWSEADLQAVAAKGGR
ncbi:MAG: flavodoxin [Synergistaceae bacterium]|nr:flavodoxin [Synergistaceae bacterium]